MKLIILEGGDRLGKSTLIEGICKHYNYDNMCIRHFGKPRKNLDPKNILDYQFECFTKEAKLLHKFIEVTGGDYHRYFDDTMIWNRSHLGEFVYSQMFRNGNGDEIKKRLLGWEQFNITRMYEQDCKTYLVTLTADPKFFLEKEDGNSFSKTLEEKTKELELFKDAHEFSTIKNKLLVRVDNNGEFKGKEEILLEVLNFIK